MIKDNKKYIKRDVQKNTKVVFLYIIFLVYTSFLIIGCPSSYDSPYDSGEIPITNIYPYSIEIPAIGQIHIFEVHFSTLSDIFTITVDPGLNNEIEPGNIRETSFDPDNGLRAILSIDSDQGYILQVIAKPTLYPEGIFDNSEEYTITVRSNLIPDTHQIVFFDINGEVVP